MRVLFQVVEFINRTRTVEPQRLKLRGQAALLMRFDNVPPARIARAVHWRVALVRCHVVDQLMRGAAHTTAVVHARGCGVQIKRGAAMRPALGKHMPPFFCKSFPLQQRQKAHTTDALRHRQSGRLQTSRCDVLPRDQYARVSPCREHPRPPRQERHVQPRIMQRTFATGERHAVVPHEDHQRVFQSRACLHHVHDPLEILVAVLDLALILGQVLPHPGQVRQEARHLQLGRIRR